MPPLRANPNIIVPSSQEEGEELYSRCERGELDGFQLWVHDFVKPDGGVGIPVFTQLSVDPKEISNALVEGAITKGPLFGWALSPTAARHPAGYGEDVGSTRDELRNALIADRRLSPNRRNAVADKIRQLLGKSSSYDLFRSRYE